MRSHGLSTLLIPNWIRREISTVDGSFILRRASDVSMHYCSLRLMVIDAHGCHWFLIHRRIHRCIHRHINFNDACARATTSSFIAPEISHELGYI